MTDRTPSRDTAPVAVTEDCTACGACLATCPDRALAIRPGGRPPLAVLPEACTGCLACLEVCPADAIALRTGTP